MQRSESQIIRPFCADCYCPLLKPSDVAKPDQVMGIRKLILSLQIHHAKLLDHFVDLNRDYNGRFFDAELGFINPVSGKFQEAFVNTDCLIEAPQEWWRDQFASTNADKKILKLRSEARPRWRALGSIYFAYHPWQRAVWQLKVANDNLPPKRP